MPGGPSSAWPLPPPGLQVQHLGSFQDRDSGPWCYYYSLQLQKLPQALPCFLQIRPVEFSGVQSTPQAGSVSLLSWWAWHFLDHRNFTFFKRLQISQEPQLLLQGWGLPSFLWPHRNGSIPPSGQEKPKVARPTPRGPPRQLPISATLCRPTEELARL